MIYAAGIGLGFGVGVVVGTAIVLWLVGRDRADQSSSLVEAIRKVTAAVTFPGGDRSPVQVPTLAEHLYDPAEDPMVPSWYLDPEETADVSSR